MASLASLSYFDAAVVADDIPLGSGFPQARGLDRQDARTPKFSGSKSKAEAAIRLSGSLSVAADLKISPVSYRLGDEIATLVRLRHPATAWEVWLPDTGYPPGGYTMHMLASDGPPSRWLDRPVDQIVCPTCRKALSIQLAYRNGTRGGLQAQPLRRANVAVP